MTLLPYHFECIAARASRSGVEFYEKEEAKDIGENYRMQYQQIFRDRVLRGARSLHTDKKTAEAGRQLPASIKRGCTLSFMSHDVLFAARNCTR
eukprot:scaffold68335_cov22-Tisochrysis_lutea.AAC.1